LHPFDCFRTNNLLCLLSIKCKFPRYICNLLSRSKKDLEHTIWQPFGGGNCYFFEGEDAWNKHWRGGKIIRRFIVYFLGDISAKNYPNRLMYIEVITCNISSLFGTQCATGTHMRFVIIFNFLINACTIYTDQRRHLTVLQ